MRPVAILKEGQPRCPSTRAVHCERAEACARGMAPHALGRPVIDYSRGMRPCVGFVALTPASVAHEGPRVHDTPGWVR